MARQDVPGTDERAEIAVIGGSGFYAMEGLTDARRVAPSTPYGAPSSPITIGTLHGRRVAFLARHDEGHRLLPSEVPYRANIYALKHLGVTQVLAVSAVGSLRLEIEPLHAVVPDQLIDRTQGREQTFFGDGVVAHVGFADPFCPRLAHALSAAADADEVTAHRGGALVVIEGPAFSTRAESELYRSWGGDIIGMTAIPEAKLAREAELCYGSICFVTDYDVWHESEADVSAGLVMRNLQANAEHARTIVGSVVASLGTGGAERDCSCGDALGDAIVTSPEAAPVKMRRRLDLLLERYWGAAP